MALPKIKKKIVPDISDAVQRAAAAVSAENFNGTPGQHHPPAKGGRPSPRSGNVIRQTLLLSEETAERLTMAYAEEQIKRRKAGEKLDKSFFIEEMIISWLEKKEQS